MSQTSGNKMFVKTTVNIMTLSEIKSEPGLLVVDIKDEPKDLSIDPVANAEVPKGFAEPPGASVAGSATKSKSNDSPRDDIIANSRMQVPSADQQIAHLQNETGNFLCQRFGQILCLHLTF